MLRANCEDVGVHHQPNSPGFDVVLIVHVACVVVSLVTLVASAVTASRLRTVVAGGGSLPEALARYFRPGVNWAGRSLYGIPVFGFVLLALSHGAYSLSDGWVLGGLFIFVVMVLLAEGVLWPAERRLQVSLVPCGPRAMLRWVRRWSAATPGRCCSPPSWRSSCWCSARCSCWCSRS